MRKLSIGRSKHFGSPSVDANALAQVQTEVAALSAGMTVAEWQVQQLAQLEQKILGMYNAALATLGAAGLQIENIEEGNAVINFLVEYENTPYSDSDLIDLVKGIRGNIQSGVVEAQVAFADKGKDVRTTLFSLLAQPGSNLEIKKLAALLYKRLELIRELFYIQMLDALQGQPRNRAIDAQIQQEAAKARKEGADLGLQIETDYTLQAFDKSERLVADNVKIIDFGQDEQGYFFSSKNELVDDAMSILSAKATVADDFFDKYLGKPMTAKNIKFGILGLVLGLIFSRLRK
jgi:hypothetical protein